MSGKEKDAGDRPTYKDQIPFQVNLTVSMSDIPDKFWCEIVEAVLGKSHATLCSKPGVIHLVHEDLPEDAENLTLDLKALVDDLAAYATAAQQIEWIDIFVQMASRIRANMGQAGERKE